MPFLKCWHHCQTLVRHFWPCWSSEYLCRLQTFSKWNVPSSNFQVNDIVLLQDELTLTSKWPLTWVEEVHPGVDGKDRVVTVQIQKGLTTIPLLRLYHHFTNLKCCLSYYIIINAVCLASRMLTEYAKFLCNFKTNIPATYALSRFVIRIHKPLIEFIVYISFLILLSFLFGCSLPQRVYDRLSSVTI